MTVQSLCRGHVRQHRFAEAEQAVQTAARSCGIHNKPRTESNVLLMAFACKLNVLFSLGKLSQIHFIAIDDAEPLGFAHEVMIEIGTIPMRVGDLVMRTCRHKHLLIKANIPWMIEFMMEERETALQAAGDLRVVLLPGAPLGEGE